MNNYTLDMLHELDYRKNLIAEQRERIELLEKKNNKLFDVLKELHDACASNNEVGTWEVVNYANSVIQDILEDKSE